MENNTKLYPWQETIMERLTEGGFQKGELYVLYAARGVGKTVLTEQLLREMGEQYRVVNNRDGEQCD
jgi:KaiC/GvpD/RAD55 family RecA-like ATPase